MPKKNVILVNIVDKFVVFTIATHHTHTHSRPLQAHLSHGKNQSAHPLYCLDLSHSTSISIILSVCFLCLSRFGSFVTVKKYGNRFYHANKLEGN